MSAPTVVLVHGAGGVAAYWHLVQGALATRGIESIAVDLPGDDPDAGLTAYVDLIVDAAAGLEDVLLVAQSLGGFSASWAAARLPTSTLVLLNAMIPRPGETAREWWGATGSAAAMRDNDVREGRDPDGGFDMETYFLHDVPPEALEPVGERDEGDAIFVEPWGLPAWPAVPTRVLGGLADRFFPYAFQQRVARERLGLEVEPVPGGHLAALSHPDAVVDAIMSGS